LAGDVQPFASTLESGPADGMVALTEMPFENLTEAGVRLPAPGDEKAWLERLVIR
jgi:hypothetical protein